MKFKNIINILFISITIGLVSLSSCTDLKEEIYSRVPENEDYEFTEADLKSMLANVYDNWRQTNWGWDGIFDIYEESSDCMMTPLRPGVGWGAYYIDMHKHTFSWETSHVNALWDRCYKTISSCNQMLEFDIIKSTPGSYAEVRAIRGLCYYLLLDNYRNVPLDTVFVHPDGFLPTQEDPQKVFNFIENEMKDIKVLLDGDEVVFGNFNYYAACMTLAKMYLNYNTWFGTDDFTYYQKAYEEVSEVINDGKFSLAPNYADLFVEDGSSCPEIIFAVVNDNISGSWGSYLAQKSLHNASTATFGLKTSTWNGSCAIPQFIESYDPEDSRLTDTWLFGVQKDQSGATIYTGGEVLNYTVSVHSIDNPGAFPMEGARFHKYEIVEGNVACSSTDVAFYRLADAYMIKAECLLRLGGYNGESEQVAADIVTMIRQRAFKDNPDKAVRTLEDLKGGSVYKYGHQENIALEGEEANWITTNEGGDDIEFGGFLDELAWEFVGEYHRRQDLVRFKLTSTDANVYTGKSWFCKDAHFNAFRNIYPIPKGAMEANSELVQNPNYN